MVEISFNVCKAIRVKSFEIFEKLLKLITLLLLNWMNLICIQLIMLQDIVEITASRF